MSIENIKADETAMPSGHPENPSKKTKALSFVKRNPVLTTAMIGIVAVVAVYFWKDIQGNNKKAAVEEMATAQLNQNNEAMLKLMAKPLVWSIRAEMLRGNMEQVNIFTTDLVKEKHFQFIYMVDPGGKIIVSTDKKLEGQPVGDRIASTLLQTDSVVIVNREGVMTLAAPVMGFDKQLAVIVLDYIAPVFVMDSDKVTAATAGKKN